MIYMLICALVFAVFLFADLITKACAAATDIQQSDFFMGLFKLEYRENPGMMLSMFEKNETAMIIITALTAVMIIGIFVLFFTLFKRNRPAQMALAIIQAGAIGNFIDRVYFYVHSGRGYVRDFLTVKKILFFPEYTCNIADIYILFGAIALVFIILFIGKHAVFPITKKWRAEAKAEDEKKHKEQNQKK